MDNESLQLDALTFISFAIKVNEVADKNFIPMNRLVSTVEEKYSLDDLIGNEYKLGKMVCLDSISCNVLSFLYLIFEIWDNEIEHINTQHATISNIFPQFRRKSNSNYCLFRLTMKLHDYLLINEI